MGKVCANCGTDNENDFKFCKNCGKELIANCPKCGKELNEEFDFCPYCGQRIKSFSEKGDAESQPSLNVFEESVENNVSIGEAVAIDEPKAETVLIEEEPKTERIISNSSRNVRDCAKRFDKFYKKHSALFKSIVAVLVFAIAFALAFCPIVELEIADDTDVNCSTIDFIKFMGATTQSAHRNLSDYGERLEKAYSDFVYETDEFSSLELTDKAESAYGEYCRAKLAYEIADTKDVAQTSAGQKFILAGLLSLVYILFVTILFALSIVNLVFAIKKEESKCQIANSFAVAALVLLIVTTFICGMAVGVYKDYFADCAIGAIVVLAVGSAISIATGVYENHKRIKKLIPSLVTVGLVLITCGCTCLPVMSAEATTVFSGRTLSGYECADVYADGFMAGVRSSNNADYYENLQSKYKTEKESILKNAIDDISNLTRQEYRDKTGTDYITRTIMPLLMNIRVASNGTVYSAAYYLIVVFGLVQAAIAAYCFSIINGLKSNASGIALKAIAFVLAIVTLIFCAVLVSISNANIEYYGLAKSLSFKIGAMTLIMAIMSGAAFIYELVDLIAAKKKQKTAY